MNAGAVRAVLRFDRRCHPRHEAGRCGAAGVVVQSFVLLLVERSALSGGACQTPTISPGREASSFVSLLVHSTTRMGDFRVAVTVVLALSRARLCVRQSQVGDVPAPAVRAIRGVRLCREQASHWRRRSVQWSRKRRPSGRRAHGIDRRRRTRRSDPGVLCRGAGSAYHAAFGGRTSPIFAPTAAAISAAFAAPMLRTRLLCSVIARAVYRPVLGSACSLDHGLRA